MILLLIFLLTVFAFTIYVLKKNKALSTNKPCHFVFTKEWSFVLKGILAILIVLHHISTHRELWCPEDTSWYVYIFDQLIPLSPIFVGMFFFFFFYGVMTSFNRTQGEYIKTFLIKRFSKVLIPWLTLSVICLLIIKLWLHPDFNIWVRCLTFFITGKSFLLGWFIPVLIMFYLFFYLLFRFFPNKIAVYALLLVVTIISLYFRLRGFGIHWWTSNLCFPVGVLYACMEKYIPNISEKYRYLCFNLLNLLVMGLIIVIASGHYGLTQLVLSLACCVLLVWYSYLHQIKKPGRILSFLSNISYELFLVHILLLRIADVYLPTYNLSIYVITPALLLISVILSWFFHMVFQKVSNSILPKGR